MFKSIQGVYLIVFALFCGSFLNAAEVNVYSARNEALIKPALDRFTAETGIEVNLLTGKADELISRLSNEGKLSRADILLTTDAGRLVRAKQLKLTQPFESDVVAKYVDETLRDDDNHWFALTTRARPIMVRKGDKIAAKIKRYEDLTSKDLKGQICIRSSSNIYNQSMIAALIEQQGEDAALAYSKGLVANFARPPKGGDRDQIKAMVAGQCSVAIANTYYLAGMLEGSDARDAQIAKQVEVIWPNQQDRGVHVNISGAALTRHAPNPESAKRLLEFLLSEENQTWYAEVNHEYPARKDVQWSDVLKGFGSFKAESVPFHRVGELNADALRIMDRAGWQ